jgi:hypothetical protein
MSGDTIVPDNVRAVGILHFSAMLDAMLLYDVVERLVALAFEGRLPVHRREGVDQIDRYIRGASERMSAAERRDLYARTLGVPGGRQGIEPNREFGDLWMRFVAAVSAFAHQPHARETPAIGQDDVRIRAKALALNVSAHGEGLAGFARSVASEISQSLDLLRFTEFQEAFGVSDIWRLVERVAAQELGASPPVARHKAMAEHGRRIFAWLATRPRRLWTRGGDALDVAVLTSQRRSASPATRPTDYDLVEACEQWLAVVGIGDP